MPKLKVPNVVLPPLVVPATQDLTVALTPTVAVLTSARQTPANDSSMQVTAGASCLPVTVMVTVSLYAPAAGVVPAAGTGP